MKQLALAATVALSLAATACGSGAAGGGGPVAPREPDERADLARFDALEDEILRDLATLDLRVARRSRMTLREEDLGRVGMSAVLTEDESVVLVDGRIDPFSFSARARGLAAVRAKLERLPSRLPSAGRGGTDAPELERGLLRFLVDEEAFRLDEEKRLPRSASALVRALVETWRTPESAVSAEQRDRAVARRLREIRESVTSGAKGAHGLDVLRARDLDDALDALEHLVDNPMFRASTAELVRVRQELEEHGGGQVRASSWEELAPRLTAHLGGAVSAESLAMVLADAETRSRALAVPALAASALSRDVLSGRLEPILFASGPCVDAVPGSRIRSMAASAEREPACHLRHSVANAQDEMSRALAYAALHDHVIVAQWALDVARGTTTLDRAARDRHLLAPPSSALSAKLERFALARPTAAIGAGYAAAILLAEGTEPVARAQAWANLGEVPLDRVPALLESSRTK